MISTDPQLHPTSAEFLELLERCMRSVPAEELPELIRIIAAGVPPELRMEVIEALPDTKDPTEPDLALRPYPELPESTPGAEMVERVETFVRRLENGHYYQGVKWDEERHEERAWGDDSWARDMDELFGCAATAYLAGNHELASRIFGRLLSTFRHADRTGVFCGPEQPEQMVQTHLSEAKRRYFRSIYFITELELRPQRLLTEMEALRSVGELEVGIRSMADTSSDGDPPLEELEQFLPGWIRILKGVRGDPRGFGREARRLLREAVELHAGVDGLGLLARETGGDHPEAYHDWVGMLVRLERIPDAIKAAREGVDRIRDPGYRARLADRLAMLAAEAGAADAAVEAARNAWRASPTLVRLLALVAAADLAEMRDAVLASEAATVLRPDWRHSDALACRLLLMVGRHEEATTRFQRADALGWGRTDHAGSVVLPFLLLSSTELPEPPRGSAIEALWNELDRTGPNYFDRRLLLDQMSSGGDFSSALLDRQKPYSELLRNAVVQHPIPGVYRPRMLGVAQLKVETVVRDILNAQHRRGQNMAARLTVAVAEAIALCQKSEDGVAFCDAVRKEYRRYSGFKEALDEQRSESPILPDRKARPDRAALKLIK